MNQWLKDFAYRIGMNPWIFIIAGLFTLITTIITISWQSVRTALMNPVNSIRNE
jgi:putative ABC transport system permease protein